MGDDDVAPHDGGLPAVHCGEEIDPETAVRRLRALASSEALYAPRSDYIDAVQRDGMSEAWRTKIMAWFGQLGDSFKLKRETLSSATNYLDRYLSRRSCGNVNFQRVAGVRKKSPAAAAAPAARPTARFPPFPSDDPRTSTRETAPENATGARPQARVHRVHLPREQDRGDAAVPDVGLRDAERRPLQRERPAADGARAALHAQVAPEPADGARVDPQPARALRRPAAEARGVGTRALRYADLVRGDVAFLQYPPSMIAVASVICALKQMGAAVGLVSDWMVRVHDCHLPYTDRPDAAQLITECGLKLIALDGDGPLGGGADDAAWPDDRSACDGDGDGVDGEVERATSGGAPLVAAHASDDEGDEGTDASDMDRTSPNNVMDVDQIEAFAQEPLFGPKR
ncbi:hypothetical protein JL720_9322 [Aureococcus anophagefferens]|nr:hypothetical protein JL720_9322 [Aureococcus anophagefferens]